jgi:integrase
MNLLINPLSQLNSMLVQQQEQEAYFNFVNSINSDVTRKNYEYCLSKFLKYCTLDLDSLLKLPQLELSNLIIKYLVSQKISSQYKTVIMATIKHACEMNDVILNWKKLKKFIKSEKTDNEINGRDRGYTHEEIQKILDFSDQRLKTAFLVLASTGIRIGALQSIRIGDLEPIDNLYKITVYRGDKEEYFTFCTPECAKEIEAYLDFRARRGEKITQDSYLLVRKFSLKTKVKGKPFRGRALWAILEDCISNSGLREIDHVNPFKRKQIPLLHGFRKYCTKQLVDSKLNPEIREMLLGHKIGLTGVYYKPTVQDMLNEYYRASFADYL